MITFFDAVRESITHFMVQTSPLEWCGVISGILCVWLAAKNKILNWPVAVISVLIYIFIFYESKLYADMGLQVYFLGMNAYGWYFWSRNRKTAAPETPVSRITSREVLLSIAGILLFTLLLGFLLRENTDAAFPFIDSFCTACSLIAQIFLARKVLENWLIWIFVDVIYVGVYAAKHLFPTALMYSLYVYIAWMGYREWKKTIVKETI